MTFTTGQTLYTATGNTVSFDHAHGDRAYVRPVQTVMRQVANSRGDDFYEEEDEVLADHLIALPLDSLLTLKPVAKLDADIAEKQFTLEGLQSAIEQTRRAWQSEQWKHENEKRAADADMERWRKTHERFRQLGRFLDGEPMFFMQASTLPNRSDLYYVPEFPKEKDVKLLAIRPKMTPKKGPFGAQERAGTDWVIVDKNVYGEYRDRVVWVFDTAADREACVTVLFEKIVAQWRARPNFNRSVYNGDIDYGRLESWVKAHPHLTIPEDVAALKAEDEEKARLDRIEAARAKLAELEGDAA